MKIASCVHTAQWIRNHFSLSNIYLLNELAKYFMAFVWPQIKDFMKGKCDGAVPNIEHIIACNTL